MSDKREGTETAPDSVQRVIADLEIIDRRLGELLAARGAPDADSRGKARTLLRSAIEALAPAAHSEASEDVVTGKRRVKIKAESEVAPPSDTGREGTAAKPGAAAKSRGGRGNAGRRPANAEKAPPGLLARLGAAVETPPGVQASTEPAAAAPKDVEAGDSLKATADRLAQLEAEIADLTEAVTGVPTRQAAAAPEQHHEVRPDTAPPGEAGGQADAYTDDGEDAEITIIGVNGAQHPAARSAAREAPRVFRDGPFPDEDEAEVEIRGDGAASHRRRVADRAGTGHELTRRSESSGGRGALAKWRIFRGSN